MRVYSVVSMDANGISKLGTILGVWAHPDDETWTSAGIMMAARASGQRVAIVTATKGELGSSDHKRWPLDTLGQTRAQELANALGIMDVHEQYWLNYQDGDCPNCSTAEACARLKEIFETVQPDTVLTFGPDGLTGHLDHKAVGRWAEMAAAHCGSKPTVYQATESKEKYQTVDKQSDSLLNIYFNTNSPYMLPEAEMDICFRLPPDLLEKKIAALRAHTSQYEKLMECLENGSISRDIASPECFRKAKTD